MYAVHISTDAPKPYMHPAVAPCFEELRKRVRIESGVDFLARCGDVLRDPDFVSTKDGVANRSWHKTGRAFDYDQSNPALLYQKEIQPDGHVMFRTYLKCVRQDGQQGESRRVLDYRGIAFIGYVLDFTRVAAECGFHRIPAWSGWESHYIRREFWHYQKDDGLTWEAAMQQIKSAGPVTKAVVLSHDDFIGLNDRDSNTDGRVSKIESRLVFYKFLAPDRADGVFDADTHAAVVGFQAANGLKQDGIVGPMTLAKLGI
jgi:hypothetical protein